MNTEPERPFNRRRLGGLSMLAGAAILLSACASAPLPPTAELDAAQTAIGVAETANAGRFASAELSEARDKFAKANSAASNKQMLAAKRLAEESKLTAELASARTETAKAVAINKELSLGVEALSEEMQRAGEQR
jgi:Domain of unknown function (DUF4398)